MKEYVLVVFKPDVIIKGLMGYLLSKLLETGLEIVSMKMVTVSKDLAEEHYQHLKDQPFYRGTVDYLQGKLHRNKRVAAFVFSGEHAIARCREIAGVTNPEQAHPKSIRGSMGRITTKGIYENVVHVSSEKREAQREIKLWFTPEEVGADIFPTITKILKSCKKKVWA